MITFFTFSGDSDYDESLLGRVTSKCSVIILNGMPLNNCRCVKAGRSSIMKLSTCDR